MAKPEKLSKDAIETFIAAHAGWKRDGDTLTKTYSFEHYGAAIAFAVHVGFAAESVIIIRTCTFRWERSRSAGRRTTRAVSRSSTPRWRSRSTSSTDVEQRRAPSRQGLHRAQSVNDAELEHGLPRR
jgi:hypothetical protein